MADSEKRGLRLFYSYTQEDEQWRKKLETHLSTLQRQDIITSWHRRQVLAGAEHNQEVAQHLEEADLILLLVSPDFIASEYCYGIEMIRALERHQLGEACVIPIMVRPTYCQGTPFAHLQALPANNKPISRWRDQDEALLDIVRSIRDVIEKWVSSRELYSTTSPTFPTQLSMRARVTYLEHIYKLYSSVRLPLGPAEGLALQAVFQPLRLRQNPLAAEDLQQEQRRKLLGEISQGQEAVDILPEVIVDTSEEALKKSHQKRIVILGGPGTGKTTTLKHLAGAAARDALIDVHASIPIFFSLADLARSGKSLQQYLHDQVESLGIEPRYADLLWKAKEDGSAFFCVDSLDEVSPELRTRMIDLIHIWATEKGNVWVVGSRFTEYKGGQFKQGQFIEWELLPMTRTVRMDLALRLFSEMQRTLDRPESTEPSPTAFVSALEQHPQAAAWGENPLLFSLAAVIYFQTKGLPATRAMLYREVIEAVLAMREPDQMRRKQLFHLLTSLALWLHQKKGRVYTLDDLLLFLEEVKQRPWNETTQITHQIVASGIMEVLARNTYGFRHQTFQEYLAAAELAHRLTSHQINIREEAWALAWSKRTYSRWTEVLRLMVGILVQISGKRGIQEAQRWIRALLDQQTTTEGDPGLLGFALALKSVVELVGSSAEHIMEIAQLEIEIVHIWADQLLNAAESSQNARLDRLQALKEDIGYLHESALKEVLTKLRAFLEHKHWRVRWCAVLALARLGKNTVSDILLKVTLSDRDINVRGEAARALGKLEELVPLEPLLDALQDVDRFVRSAAASALGKLGERVPLDPLLIALQDGDSLVRSAAAQALGELGERAPLEPLLVALQDRHYSVRSAAAQALGGLGERVPVEPLLIALRDTSWHVRSAAVRALGKPGERVPLEPLLVVLQDDDWRVRDAAVGTLGKLEDRVSLEQLLAVLQDSQGEVRATAVRTLGKLGVGVPLEPLLVLLQDSESFVRQMVGRALRERIPLAEILDMVKAEHKDTFYTALQMLMQWKDQETLKLFLPFLKDSDIEVRRVTAEILGMYAEWVLVEPLLEALQDSNQRVRLATINAFHRCEGQVPLEPLLAALQDTNWQVRLASVWVLGELGERTPLEPLLVALQDKDWQVRRASVQVLGELGERTPLEPLLLALQDNVSAVCKVAEQTLDKLKERVSLEFLLSTLQNSDSTMRSAALQALGRLGGNVPLEPLLAMLQDSNNDVRCAALEALGKLGERVPLEPLLAMLQDSDTDVRCSALLALGEQGERVPLDSLLAMLQDGGTDVRCSALLALGEQGERVPLEPLLGMLQDNERDVRSVAVGVLGQLGKRVPLEPLLAMLQDGDSDVRISTLYTLNALDEKILIEIWPSTLRDTNSKVRMAIIRVLGSLGSQIPLEALLTTLQDGNWHVRRTTAEVLVSLGESAPLESFVILLCDNEEAVRNTTARALGKAGLLKPLLIALQNGNSDTREAVIRALGELGEQAPLEPLLVALQDDHYWVRRTAAQALGNLGERAPLEPLLAMLEDIDKSVRAAAAQTLERLGERVPTNCFISMLCDDDIKVKAAAFRALKLRAPNETLDDVMAEAAAIAQKRPSGKYLGSLTQGYIAELIGNLGVASPELFKKLLSLLDWHHWQVRAKSAQAFGNIRRNIPDEAIRRLLKLRHDPVRAVQQAADDALSQILSLETGIEDD